MSGHSKWSTIKRQKGITDARRSSAFTKLGRLITVAARAGGKDPDMNFQLRLAIDKAKAANMPNENIERAIKSGVGELKGDQTKEVVYEGFGPGGTAVIVQAVTDNSNRTASEVRSTWQKFGGHLGSQNSVAWMFQLKGVIRIPVKRLDNPTLEKIELDMIDAGADDVERIEDALVIASAPEKLGALGSRLTASGIAEFQASTDLLPTTTVSLDEATSPQLYRFLEALDELDDVTEVHSNDV